MIDGRVRPFLVVGAILASLIARPSYAAEPGYNVWFAGHVLSVDAHRGSVRIARGPTETSGPAVEECLIGGPALKLIHPGMLVEAQADTRRRPWKVLHLRVMQRNVRSHSATAAEDLVADRFAISARMLENKAERFHSRARGTEIP